MRRRRVEINNFVNSMQFDIQLLNIIKGFLIGICSSIPIGPIAIFVIQQSLTKGHKAGFITGLGATIVDTTFACISIFALAYAQEFMDRHSELILIVGGVVVAVIGVIMAFSNPVEREARLKKDERITKIVTGKSNRVSINDFLKSILMGITNPGGILVLFTLFTVFGIDTTSNQDWTAAPIILAVAAGTIVYWFLFSWLISHFRKYVKIRTLIWINRITGAIVAVLGLALLSEGLFRVLFQGAKLF